MSPRRERPCPRCLIGDLPDGAALAALNRRWIEALPAERRTPDDVYRARLEACRACEHLAAGLCALCGCYVEYRAAQRSQPCPDVPGRWRE